MSGGKDREAKQPMDWQYGVYEVRGLYSLERY